MTGFVLLVKRDGIDKNWQVAPYRITSREHGERLAAWLTRALPALSLQYRVVET